MDRRLLASPYAVTMDAAGTFIIWRLILLIRDGESVSVYSTSAWRVCAALVSSASLSGWPTIIRAAVNFGSGAAGKRSPGPSRWELIFSGRKRVASKHSIFRDRSRHNRRLQLFSVQERACVDGDFRERNSCASWLMHLWTRNKIQPLPGEHFLARLWQVAPRFWREDRTQSLEPPLRQP